MRYFGTETSRSDVKQEIPQLQNAASIHFGFFLTQTALAWISVAFLASACL